MAFNAMRRISRYLSVQNEYKHNKLRIELNEEIDRKKESMDKEIEQ